MKTKKKTKQKIVTAPKKEETYDVPGYRTFWKGNVKYAKYPNADKPVPIAKRSPKFPNESEFDQSMRWALQLDDSARVGCPHTHDSAPAATVERAQVPKHGPEECPVKRPKPRTPPPGVVSYTAVAGSPPTKPANAKFRTLRDWAEQTRDWYLEKKRQWLTSEALSSLAFHAFKEVERGVKAAARVALLYDEEHATTRMRGEAMIKATGIPAGARKTKEEETYEKETVAMLSNSKPKKDQPRLSAEYLQVQNGHGILVEKTNTGKFKVFGQHVTAVIRWCGYDAWTEQEVRRMLNRIGLKEVKNSTIKSQYSSGKQGKDGPHGQPAELTPAQEKKLRAVVEGPRKKSRK